MEETGVMLKLHQTWTHIPNEVFWTANAISLGYDNAAFPFLGFAWGVLATAVLLIVEILHHLAKKLF